MCESRGMYLRGLEPGDPDRMYALDVLCFAEPFRFSRSAMRRFALAPGALVRLAFADADEGAQAQEPSLLGFSIVHLQRSRGGVTGYVTTLDVHPAARGKGIARVLMEDLQVAAKGSGAATMSLHVYAENPAAIRLYQRLGYGCLGRIPDFYSPGLDALYFELTLSQQASEPHWGER